LFPQLFDMDEKNIYVKTFIYGLWCGLLSLLYTPFLLLLIFIYIVFLTEKFYKFRAFILPVAGSCLAYIYLFTGLYLFDQTDMLHIFIENIKASVADFGISLSLSGERNMYYVGIAILMGVIAFLKVLSKSSSVVIYRRKKQYVLLWMILLQSVITICFHAPYFLFAQILLLLLTIMLSLYLLYVKRRTIYYLMALLLFISALYSNFL
ncbi:MAG: hypothetical protein LBQ64_06710, partial [Bacteroidales bacterium]|nr:hypothetical protein [Bacteroidales bacterium]